MIGYNNREKSMEAVLDVSVSSARNASTCFRESGGGSGPTQLCSRATTISQRVTRFFNDFRKVSSNYGRRKAGNGISGLKRARSRLEAMRSFPPTVQLCRLNRIVFPPTRLRYEYGPYPFVSRYPDFPDKSWSPRFDRAEIDSKTLGLIGTRTRAKV